MAWRVALKGAISARRWALCLAVIWRGHIRSAGELMKESAVAKYCRLLYAKIGAI